MSLLSDRQQKELNKSIVQYLKTNIRNDQIIEKISTGLDVDLAEDLGNVIPNYLEKKWSTVIRLQKKILDLETEVSNLHSIIDSNKLIDKKTSSQKFNWIPNTNSTVLKNHKDSVNSIAIHPYLPQLISGSNDGDFIVWDLMNPLTPEKVVKAHIRSINSICFSPSEVTINRKTNQRSQYLLATCSSDLLIRIWDSEFNQIRTLSGHEHTISSIKFKPNDSNHLYSCSRDKSVRLWDITNGWCLKQFVGHSDWVRDIDVSLNGEYVLSCSNDQSIRLSHGDSGTGLALLLGHGHVVETCKFLPALSNEYLDNISEKFIPKEILQDELYNDLTFKYCISGGRDDTIKIWLLPLPTLRPHGAPIPNSDPTGKLILELKGHTSWIKALEIHPNGKYVFSCADDKTIRVWDLSAGGRCIKTLKGHDGFVNDLKFAPLVETQVSDVANGDDKTPQEIEKERIEKNIRCLFASGGVDTTIRLWS